VKNARVCRKTPAISPTKVEMFVQQDALTFITCIFSFSPHFSRIRGHLWQVFLAIGREADAL